MSARNQIKAIDVNEDNVFETGFFCCMSKKKSKGYQRKLQWLKKRFAEGMRIKIIKEGGRGFIEYIPGEYAWRPVNADGYMFIHCLWVVGKSKGTGCGAFLLNKCIEDAKKQKMKGVAMVTSEGIGLADKRLLLKNGFESVDKAPPFFDLMVKRFGKAGPPSFADGWDAKSKRFGKGLTVVRSDQCPYNDDAVKAVIDVAKELGIESRVIELKDRRSVLDASPSAYGAFGIVYNGALLSYHNLTRRELLSRLKKQLK
jgi:hypothetical protein